MDRNQLLQLFNYAAQNRASDLHFREGQAPAIRLKGDLRSVRMNPFTSADMLELFKIALGEKFTKTNLDDIFEKDGSFDVPNLCRFRFNIFRHGGKLGAALRVISFRIPTFVELGLPHVLKDIANFDRGMVLVTGATGMGKSTTMAAMVDHLNTTKRGHILTIEDPIEFLHPQKLSRVTQREVGIDTRNFTDGLKSALRQDPDVILLGEMRDPESMDIALKAAETGHLVLATVHTTDATKTIARLISMFPTEEQKEVRTRLAHAIKASVSQRLLPRQDGKGLICAHEIMISNHGIQECIIDPHRTSEMRMFIEKSHEVSGGQSFEQHLTFLYRKGIISLDVAKDASSNPGDFERAMHFTHAEALIHASPVPPPAPGTATDESSGSVIMEIPKAQPRKAA